MSNELRQQLARSALSARQAVAPTDLEEWLRNNVEHLRQLGQSAKRSLDYLKENPRLVTTSRAMFLLWLNDRRHAAMLDLARNVPMLRTPYQASCLNNGIYTDVFRDFMNLLTLLGD